MAFVVDTEKCNGCGECVATCPVEALQLVDGKPTIDNELCVECGACEDACPTGAIQIAEASETP